MSDKITVNKENLNQVIRQLAPQLVQYDKARNALGPGREMCSDLIAPPLESAIQLGSTYGSHKAQEFYRTAMLETKTRLGAAAQNAIDVGIAIIGRTEVQHFVTSPKTLLLPHFKLLQNNGAFDLVTGYGNTADQAILEMRINAAYLGSEYIWNAVITAIGQPRLSELYFATGYA